MEAAECIKFGKAVLGIEFGSTRIKAVLTDQSYHPIAQGSHEWENRYENGIWTYSIEDILDGLQGCYKSMADDAEKKYGVKITVLAAMGISAMMHGFMAFDRDGRILTPFRTWRNTITEEASDRLTKLFNFNIPQRWSTAHLYQAILNKEPYISKISFFTTLSGYVHWKLTGRKVLGAGDASGMFPIDESTGNYNRKFIKKFNELDDVKKYGLKLENILPMVLSAGECAGSLTEEGAKLLDPSGNLKAGIPLCPPEGDAGTGMTATNSVSAGTGNVSAGTSIFAMVVMKHYFRDVHRELDLVTTPDGKPVAMVHCNNCTSDLNAWIKIFAEYNELTGVKMDMNTLYGILYRKALEGDPDCGGILSYNYFSGEPVTDCHEGRPMQVRKPDDRFNLANFMRSNLYSSMATLKIGMDILQKKEKVHIDKMYAHGGLFKTKGVGQRFMAAAIDAPVSLMSTAGEGGAWGIALLASFMIQKEKKETLSEFLDNKVFSGMNVETAMPEEDDVKGFNLYIEGYKVGLSAEKEAGRVLA